MALSSPLPPPCRLGVNPGLVADLFHALNQPLAALRCSLELGLHIPRSAEQYRECLHKALPHVEEAARWAAELGDLIQAREPDGSGQRLSLDASIRDLAEFFGPVAESRDIGWQMEPFQPCAVRFVPERLQQALFKAAEFVLDSTRSGGTIRIRVCPAAQMVTVEFSASPVEDPPSDGTHSTRHRELRRQLVLAIAAEVLAGAGGHLTKEEAGGKLAVGLHLPVADADV